MHCPRCQQEMTFDWAIGTMRCHRCQHQSFEAEARAIREHLVPPLPGSSAAESAGAPAAAQTTPAGRPPGQQTPPIDISFSVMDLSDLPTQLEEIEQMGAQNYLAMQVVEQE